MQGKAAHKKTLSGWTLPRTLSEQELRAPGCPYLFGFVEALNLSKAGTFSKWLFSHEPSKTKQVFLGKY
jgi:hypothetical protein